MSEVKVWIDQDLCTGDGLCVEICPPLFGMHDDGLAYVKEESWVSVRDKGDGTKADSPFYEMGTGLANVPEHLLESAIEAAEDCPGECIFFKTND